MFIVTTTNALYAVFGARQLQFIRHSSRESYNKKRKVWHLITY